MLLYTPYYAHVMVEKLTHSLSLPGNILSNMQYFVYHSSQNIIAITYDFLFYGRRNNTCDGFEKSTTTA